MINPEPLVGKWAAQANGDKAWRVTGYLEGDAQYFTMKDEQDKTEIWTFCALRNCSFFDTDRAAHEFLRGEGNAQRAIHVEGDRG